MCKEHFEDKNPGEDRRQEPRIKFQVWAREKGDNYTCFHSISNLSRNGLFIEMSKADKQKIGTYLGQVESK